MLKAGNAFDVLSVQRSVTNAAATAARDESMSILAGGKGELCILSRQRLTDAYEKVDTLEKRRDLETKRVLSAKGPFAVLGLPRDANDADVDKRVKDLAALLHPDHGGSDEVMKVVNEAKDRLKDKEMKEKYIKSNPMYVGKLGLEARQKV